jgi:hypothetical protein
MRAHIPQLSLSVLLGEHVRLRLAVVLLIALLASAFLACGGGKFDPAYQAGQLACDGHAKKSYHYTVKVLEEQVAVPPATPDPNTPPAMASWDIQGAVEGGDRIGSLDAHQHNEVTGGAGDVEVIFLENGDSFFNLGDEWKAVSDATGSVNLAFQPLNICNALAPDADTTKLGASVAESVNGIPSLKFSFQDLPSEFTARIPDLTGGDAGNQIKTISGSVWVAERGNLITKLEVTGSGQYPDGQKAIDLDLKFEVSELDTEVSVKAPI